MLFTSETTSNGVVERLFTVGEVPGVLWTPAGATGTRPLVLLGHGGGTHKKTSAVLAHAHYFVTAYGFAAAAIDAPWHGDRPRTEEAERLLAAFRKANADGDITGLVTEHNAAVAPQAVPEWQTTLTALQNSIGAGPVGYWGVSMGTVIGVPLVAAEPRITAAVLGLAGHPSLNDAAARITIPVRFLLQWHDELVPRDATLALFDAFASPRKTLHANPGRHREVPIFELESTGRFLKRHLTA